MGFEYNKIRPPQVTDKSWSCPSFEQENSHESDEKIRPPKLTNITIHSSHDPNEKPVNAHDFLPLYTSTNIYTLTVKFAYIEDFATQKLQLKELSKKMGVAPEVPLGCSGKTIPAIGLGTVADPRVDAETTKAAVLEAIKAGYRHFDTAFAYGSEQPLGEAIAEALSLGLVKSRDEFFITTKLWCTFAERDQIVPAIKMSLK